MKYVRLIPALLLAVLMASCNTTKKLYEAQEYDQVIQRLAPDATRGYVNGKEMNMLAASYHKANQADHERIQALKATGQPDVWPEIYQRYCSMKGRNEALSKLPRKVKRGMNYTKLDLDEDMLIARNKAEAFLVAKASQLLASGSKEDAEEAETYIVQLAHTNRQNGELMQLKKKQVLCAADVVTIGFSDEKRLTPDVANTVLDFDDGEIPFKMARVKKTTPMVTVTIDRIDVSPIRLDEVTFKENQNGGSVSVTDHSQNKSVTLTGSLEYYNSEGRRIGKVPFEVKSHFKNDYTTIYGDRSACSEETLRRLNSKSVPVPTDESLMLDAAKKLNDLIAVELKK